MKISQLWSKDISENGPIQCRLTTITTTIISRLYFLQIELRLDFFTSINRMPIGMDFVIYSINCSLKKIILQLNCHIRFEIKISKK